MDITITLTSGCIYRFEFEGRPICFWINTNENGITTVDFYIVGEKPRSICIFSEDIKEIVQNIISTLFPLNINIVEK